MKYLLLLNMNPTLWATLTEEEHNEIFAGHDAFQAPLRETGELLGFVALADPTNTKTVRVRDGVLEATDGPYIEAKEFLAGYYAVETETLDRAIELAGQIPDAKYMPVEVRPVMAEAGLEM